MEGSVAASPGSSVTRRRTRRLVGPAAEGGAEEGASLVWRRFSARTSVSGGVGAGAFLVNPCPPSRRAVAAARVAGVAGAVAAARVADVFSCCCFSWLFQRISSVVSLRDRPCSSVSLSHTILSSLSSRDSFSSTHRRREVHSFISFGDTASSSSRSHRSR